MYESAETMQHTTSWRGKLANDYRSNMGICYHQLPSHANRNICRGTSHENGPTPRTQIWDPHSVNFCHIFDYNGNISPNLWSLPRANAWKLHETRRRDYSPPKNWIRKGNICSILAPIVAGFIERKRRAFAILHGNLMHLFQSCGWHRNLIGNSLVFLTVSVATYLNSLVVALVHSWTIKHDKHSWLADDINVGKLDYFYFSVAALGLLNFIFFLFVARRHRYKACW